MLEWKRGGLTQEILDKHFVLAGGRGEVPAFAGWYSINNEEGPAELSELEGNEWYCVLPEITVHDPGMDWVDLPQDHVFRAGDEYYSESYDEWQPAKGVIGQKVGKTISQRGRCRRKDLPPQKRKIVLTEWLCLQAGTWYRMVRSTKPVGDEVIRIKDHEYEVDAQ
jgi:hypothetical protein